MNKLEAIKNIRNDIKVKQSLGKLEKLAENGDELTKAILAFEVFNSRYKLKEEIAFKNLLEYVSLEKPGKKWSVFYECLGRCYLFGDGTRKNFKNSFKMIKIAAEMKRVWSINCLGDFYFDGTGTPRSYKKAFFWYKLAEKEGPEPITLLRLGYLYYHGYGVKQDVAKARHYYLKSYQHGNLDAGYNLVLLDQEIEKINSVDKKIIKDLIKKKYKKSKQLLRLL